MKRLLPLFFLLLATHLSAGTLLAATVSGRVTDTTGAPVVGAYVSILGTNNVVPSGVDGSYTLTNVAPGNVIQVSFLGYVTQTVTWSDQSRLDFVLEQDSELIDAVVMIGYGSMKKSDLTSSVSSIRNDVISSAATSNIGDILQGRVPGMDLQTSRYEGDNREIRIRGDRSIKADNGPLVIVDGVTGDMNLLSPNDIESIEILKDAASAAIYGSRGANGVIIVTTKKGRAGGTDISYNGYYGFRQADMMDMMPGEKFAQLRRDAYLISNNKWGQNVPDSDIFHESELAIINSGKYVNWFDLMFRDGAVHSHNLSLRSGTEKTKFNLSFTYEREKGYARTNETDKFYFNSSVDHSVAKWMDAGASVRLRKRNSSGFLRPGQELMYGTPIVAPYDQNGELVEFPNRNETFLNLLYNYEPGQYINDTQNLNADMLFYSDIHPLPYLRMRTNFGYNVAVDGTDYFYGNKSLPTAGGYKESRRSGENSYQWTFNNTVTFDRTFNNHHVTVDGIVELFKARNDTWMASGRNQDIDYLSYYNLETNSENKNISSGAGDSALASFMSRLRYDYKGRYLFNLSVRTDGSSRLADGNKWATFPSGGVAWRISGEEFMQSVNWLYDLKIRASLGTVGNQAVDPYNSLDLLSTYRYMFGDNGFYAYRPASISNKMLTWEKTTTANLGLDFSLWRGRLSGTMEYYTTRTTNLLLERSLPQTIGYSRIMENVGETANRGFELTLNAALVERQDFRVDMSLIYSTNVNKIVRLNSPNDDITNRWFIGKPISVAYDYERLGIWQLGEEEQAAVYGRVPGQVKVKDQTNEAGRVGIGPEDRVILGQTTPKHLASINGSVQWKALDFSFNLNSRWDYLVSHDGYGWHVILSGNRWVPDIDYWTPDNPTNDYPRAHTEWAVDRELGRWMKGDYIKVQDITLGYDFSRHMRNFPIEKARLYIQGRNLGYLYRAAKENIHPESTDIFLTIPKTFIIGLNVNF